MTTQKLSREARDAALQSLDGWRIADDRDAIRKLYKFRDFNAAFGFMSRVAMAAEALDHHPEWSNVYSRVDVILTTHSAGGLSELDIKLAETMDRLAGETGLKG